MVTLVGEMRTCSSLVLLDIIANRWSVLALDLLYLRSHRFNEMRREMGGISQKMLSQTLKSLERDGMVNRKVTPSSPIAVEYSLTALGRTFVEKSESLRRWSDANHGDILKARERFDLERSWMPAAFAPSSARF